MRYAKVNWHNRGTNSPDEILIEFLWCWRYVRWAIKGRKHIIIKRAWEVVSPVKEKGEKSNHIWFIGLKRRLSLEWDGLGSHLSTWDTMLTLLHVDDITFNQRLLSRGLLEFWQQQDWTEEKCEIAVSPIKQLSKNLVTNTVPEEMRGKHKRKPFPASQEGRPWVALRVWYHHFLAWRLHKAEEKMNVRMLGCPQGTFTYTPAVEMLSQNQECVGRQNENIDMTVEILSLCRWSWVV